MTSTYASALIAEIARYGVSDYSIKWGGKHPRLEFFHASRKIMFVFAASPSDQCGVHNALSDLRRVMRVHRVIYKSPKPPRRRGAGDTAASALPKRPRHGGSGSSGAPIPLMPATFTVKPNPWERLAPRLAQLNADASALALDCLAE